MQLADRKHFLYLSEWGVSKLNSSAFGRWPLLNSGEFQSFQVRAKKSRFTPKGNAVNDF
jgi:hypothetical protein